MKKKSKVMTTMGILGLSACAGMGAYMYMCNNKKKIQKQLEKYMSCPNDLRQDFFIKSIIIIIYIRSQKYFVKNIDIYVGIC